MTARVRPPACNDMILWALAVACRLEPRVAQSGGPARLGTKKEGEGGSGRVCDGMLMGLATRVQECAARGYPWSCSSIRCSR